MPVPVWIRNHFNYSKVPQSVKTLLREHSLHTVCEAARCPNICECFQQNTATFLILGDKCTRNCKFCAISKGEPEPLNEEEPNNIALASQKLNLSYVVVTSVTRDDLIDGGSSIFSSTINAIHKLNKRVEVLIPDFNGNKEALVNIINAHPEVLNHNIETVPRLYSSIRPMANYARSLYLLQTTKEIDKSIITKSGFMIGLGETEDEIINLMEDLREVEVDILTIGQYIRPPGGKINVSKYYTPEEFFKYENLGYELGFSYVVSGPLVRSSYKAEEAYWGSKLQSLTNI